MPRKLYTRLITSEDILTNFGYNLEEIVNVGAFPSKNLAVEAWLDEACESINSLILEKRGFLFVEKLNSFLNIEANKDDGIYSAIYWAQMYEMRFFIDNGRFESVGKIDPLRKKHDEQAINILYTYGIIKDGVM